MSKTFNRKLPWIGIDVREADMKQLGSWEPKKLEIRIKRDQPKVGKHITILHEGLHAVNDILKEAGIVKRRVDHDFIENAAYNLLLFLVAAKLWRGVTLKDLRAFEKWAEKQKA